jgi:hypothetical protein
MFPINVKASEQVAVLGVITPTSQGIGAAVSGWLPMVNYNKLLALVSVGAFGAAATVDANLQQATDNAGTGAKAFSPARAIVQALAAGGNNIQVELNLDAQEFDVENNYQFVQLTVTVAAAATLTSAVLLGFNPRNAPANANNAASVTQIVG